MHQLNAIIDLDGLKQNSCQSGASETIQGMAPVMSFELNPSVLEIENRLDCGLMSGNDSPGPGSDAGVVGGVVSLTDLGVSRRAKRPAQAGDRLHARTQDGRKLRDIPQSETKGIAGWTGLKRSC